MKLKNFLVLVLVLCGLMPLAPGQNDATATTLGGGSMPFLCPETGVRGSIDGFQVQIESHQVGQAAPSGFFIYPQQGVLSARVYGSDAEGRQAEITEGPGPVGSGSYSYSLNWSGPFNGPAVGLLQLSYDPLLGRREVGVVIQEDGVMTGCSFWIGEKYKEYFSLVQFDG